MTESRLKQRIEVIDPAADAEIDSTSAWDGNAASRERELSEFDDPSYRAIINLINAKLKNLIPEATGKQICDVGCGTGHESEALARLGFEVVAMDPSARSIALARERAGRTPNIDFEVSTVEAFADGPSNESSFDGLIADMVIHCAPKLSAFANACAKLLKPHGSIIAAIPDPLNYLQSRDDLDVRHIDLTRDQILKIPFRIHGHAPHPEEVYYFHRPFKSILAAFRGAGLSLSDLSMPAQVGIGKPRDVAILTFTRDD